MVIAEFFFVLFDLAIEFVSQPVDRSIHVTFHGVRIELATTHIYGGLRFVLKFFNCEDAMNIGNVVKMPSDTRELVIYIFA